MEKNRRRPVYQALEKVKIRDIANIKDKVVKAWKDIKKVIKKDRTNCQANYKNNFEKEKFKISCSSFNFDLNLK